jgi:hypothetical protein
MHILLGWFRPAGGLFGIFMSWLLLHGLPRAGNI